MAINKATRLSKVAREFNVGLATIVDFLKKKGHEVELNPNTKITPELYELVAKEYSSELSIKKESEKLSLKNLREKKEAVSLSEKEEAVEEAEDESDEPDEEEVLIKDTREKSAEEEKPITEKKNLKVVGKIDLDAIDKKAPQKKEEEPAKTEPEQETQPVEEPKQEEKPKEGGKPAPVAAEKPETPKAEKKEEKEEIKEEKAAEETPKTEEKVEKEKTGPRIVGKIDLNPPRPKAKPAAKEEEKVVPAPEKTEEQKAAPKKEKKPEPPKEVEKTTPAAKADAPAPAEAKKEEKPEEQEAADTKNQFIQTDFKKLSGPTVVGKINLPEKQEKRKPVASSRDDKDKRKRKRKRIRVETNKKVPVEQQQKEKARTDQQDAKSKSRKKRKPARQEVSEEDVQKQIKDTLARLTSKGSKSKGAKYRREKRDQQSIRHQEEMEKQAQEKNVLKVTEFVSVNELANMMDVAPTEVISVCMNLGLFVSINQRLDAETMALVADEFDYKVEFVSIDLQESIKEEEDDPKDLESRPPIVTVMGHVDHGKTKLLDYIRHTNVIGGEAGGITQHIGAYSVQLDNGKEMTFLDTPGHEAFTAMRARGAQITDVAIIVVAADDGVKPQTVEAINHAHAAGVPIVFAINKIDKSTSNVEKIKEELANMNFLVEDWGGKYQSQEISAKNGVNIEELLEKVLLEAELLDLKANPNKRAKGTVIESTLDRGRGYVATVLVEAGTLNMSDMMLAGSHFGHVKAMYNERGKQIDKAGPATPVLILGLNGAPQAGDDFHVMETDREAKEIANKREQLQREQGLRTQKHITLDEIGRRIAIGNFQELNVIVKGDVDGSVEALSDSLIKLSTEEIQVNVIHKAVGQISESDILLAVASNAIIIGFQVRPSLSARKLAEKEEIDIRLYSIIYDAINELRDAMEGMLSPDVKENITATLEIREVFKITKVGTIAGCIVREGKINRNSKVRVIREGIVVYTGDLGSLKRFKEDVREVGNGYECGLNIANFNDIKVGDIVESFEEIEVKKKL